MGAGETFTFICSDEQSFKMEKVIHFRNGRIEEKRRSADGIVFAVGKLGSY